MKRIECTFMLWYKELSHVRITRRDSVLGRRASPFESIPSISKKRSDGGRLLTASHRRLAFTAKSFMLEGTGF